MFRKIALTVVLSLVPAVAMAQEHQHQHADSVMAHHNHAAMMGAAHANFLTTLIEKRAELKLTEEQVAKLEDISARMSQHHQMMQKPGAKPDSAFETSMHNQLMAIFTPDQIEMIRPMMQQHMQSMMCDSADAKVCKMPEKKKIEL